MTMLAVRCGKGALQAVHTHMVPTLGAAFMKLISAMGAAAAWQLGQHWRITSTNSPPGGAAGGCRCSKPL
jgi:hypothetical protein